MHSLSHGLRSAPVRYYLTMSWGQVNADRVIVVIPAK
jgi:hypothetical protein